jgi:stage III sporulation protein SpoIIIAA
MNINDDLEKLIENLPFFLQEQLNQHTYKDQLIEIVLDLGRRPEARFSIGPEYLITKNYFLARYRLYNKTN